MNFNVDNDEIFGTLPATEKPITMADIFALITAARAISDKSPLELSSSEDLSESDAGDGSNINKLNHLSIEESRLRDEDLTPSTSKPIKPTENNIPNFLLRTYTSQTELEDEEEPVEWDDGMDGWPCACFLCKRRKTQKAY